MRCGVGFVQRELKHLKTDQLLDVQSIPIEHPLIQSLTFPAHPSFQTSAALAALHPGHCRAWPGNPCRDLASSGIPSKRNETAWIPWSSHGMTSRKAKTVAPRCRN